MIPSDLAAFRALMLRAATYATDALGTGYDEEGESVLRADADTLSALATVTPEQLLGVVFTIRDEYQQDAAAGPVRGYYVTPREDA